MFDWVLNMPLRIQKPLIKHIPECFEVTYEKIRSSEYEYSCMFYVVPKVLTSVNV